MIRFIYYIAFVLLSFVPKLITAQSTDKYDQGMTKAFELWESGKHMEAANVFERISNVEKENWVPYYYVAYINAMYSFNEKNEEKLSLQLDKAREFVEKAYEIAPDNVELIVLDATINTAWIAFDGQKYGMNLSGKNTELYKKALELAPENPRVVLSKAEWDMGSARFFGQDTSPFCKDVERSLELFVNFKEEIKFYPQWGEDRARQVLKSCKS